VKIPRRASESAYRRYEQTRYRAIGADACEMITPPIGLNCFIVARYAGRPVGEVFKGTFPHFIAHLVAIAFLVAFRK